jgi:hypothetical protein
VLDAAIILCGSCSSSVAVWLPAKVKLTGNTDDIIRRNIKKDAAVKYPRHLNASALTKFTSNIREENYLRVVVENPKMELIIIYHLIW